MKIIHSLVFFLLILVLRKAIGGAIKAPLHIITLEDVTNAEREELKAIGEQYERTKRSGSGSPDLLSSLKYILASGAKAKLTLLGRASAAASSSIASSSSSSKSYSDHEYVYHHPPEHPKSDPWSSKKSVLNTLLQAVKAIKGGVLALKGQLIKGGGYLLVGGGNLVKSKGEAISNLGKKIARNAFRDIHPDHSSEVHEDVSYGHYHSIGTKYGPPSEPIHVDHFHHDFHDPYPDKTPGPQSGILILKRAPSGKELHSLHGSETNIASVASVEPEPQFGNIVGKLLSAGSSLNPDAPAPFTNYKQPYPQPIQYTADQDDHSNDSDQHDQGNFDSDFELEPAFDSPEANRIIEPQKTGELKFGPDSFSHENQADNHNSPDLPSVEQALPHISTENVHTNQQNLHVNPHVPTIHVNNDFNQQPPLENSAPSFSSIHKPNLFEATLNSGPFAEPPSSNQNFLGPNTQSSVGNTIYIPETSNHLNAPQLSALNFAQPLPLGSPYQDLFPAKENFNQGPPMSIIPYNHNFFEHNFAAPPKHLFHNENSLDLQAPPRFEVDHPPFPLVQNSLTAGVKIDHDFKNFVELRDTKSNKPQSFQSSRKPTKNYNNYRGVVRGTPVVNAHFVNPSSHLDLPHLTPNLKKFNPNVNQPPKYPPFKEGHLAPNKQIHGLTPPSINKNKPFSQPIPTRHKAFPQPNFDLIQSITYQLGPNGPKMI